MKAWHYRLTYASGHTHDMFLHGHELDRCVNDLLSRGITVEEVYIQIVLDGDSPLERDNT